MGGKFSGNHREANPFPRYRQHRAPNMMSSEDIRNHTIVCMETSQLKERRGYNEIDDRECEEIKYPFPDSVKSTLGKRGSSLPNLTFDAKRPVRPSKSLLRATSTAQEGSSSSDDSHDEAFSTTASVVVRSKGLSTARRGSVRKRAAKSRTHPIRSLD
ncbi:hypothetical protein AAMO2058_000878100 [Amorphochlora amoebiformis]